MLLPGAHLEGIASGDITVAFRRWRRPTVRAGGTLRTRVGVLAIDAVDRVTEQDITDADARRAGHQDRAAALAALRDEGLVYRISFHLVGPDPRIVLREDDDLGDADVADVRRRLDRLDRASRHGPWTRATLIVIRDRPEVRAPDLAASVGRDTQPFKRDVRKLKELGLTESLRIGYRLSPRGRAVLRRLGADAPSARTVNAGSRARAGQRAP